MIMLGEQIKELREAARNIQGKLGRCLYRRKDVDEMQQVSGMLFEAADTIESLRDKFVLQNEKGIIYGREQIETLEAKWKANNSSRWFELFGTPERAARTLAKIPCDSCCESCSLYGAGCDYYGDGQLEWLKDELRGDA